MRRGEPGSASAVLFADRRLQREHERQARRYGESYFRRLENGRVRYYDRFRLVRTAGMMLGNQRVREWEPATHRKRTWFQTVDRRGRVRRVRVVGINGYFEFDENGHYIQRTQTAAGPES